MNVADARLVAPRMLLLAWRKARGAPRSGLAGLQADGRPFVNFHDRFRNSLYLLVGQHGLHAVLGSVQAGFLSYQTFVDCTASCRIPFPSIASATSHSVRGTSTANETRQQTSVFCVGLGSTELPASYCGRGQDISRKAAACMVRVMREVTRQKKVATLKQSKAVTLMFDEKSPNLVLRYRCAQAAIPSAMEII